MDFPPAPCMGNIEAYTQWVHEVIDSGKGQRREVDCLAFDDLTGDVIGIRLRDRTVVDLRDGLVYDGADVRNFERRLAELSGGVASHRLNGVDFHVLTGRRATRSDVQELIAAHAPEGRPIGRGLSLA